MQDNPLLTRPDVCAIFRVDASTIYRWIKAGSFPKPVKVGPGSSRWLRSEVEAALSAMAEVRNV